MSEEIYQFGNKDKKILLIEPPFYKFLNYERWHYPITLTLIGTYLNERGYDVKIYDADKPTPDCKSLTRTEIRNNYHLYTDAIDNKEHPYWLEIRDRIKEYKPDVVGITSITAKIDSANNVAKICRELYGDNIKIILGGPHVQGMSRMSPNYSFGSYYDYTINYIPNLVDRTPDKTLLLDYDSYSPNNLSAILTSTGCPNKCTFCCNSTTEKIMHRDIKSIEKEISDLQDNFGIDMIHFMDDCILSNTKRYNELVEILYDRRLEYNMASRLMALTQEKIKTFKEKGGLRIHIGVESGSQRVLNLIKKRIETSEIIRRTKWLNEYEVNWQAFFMVGFPFETLEEIKMTEELAYKIEPSFISLNHFTPYPGTEICNEYFKDYNFDFKNVFQLSPNSCVKLDNDVEEYIERMYTNFDKYNKRKEDDL